MTNAGQALAAAGYVVGGVIGGIATSFLGKNAEIDRLKSEVADLQELKNKLYEKSDDQQYNIEKLNETIAILQNENNLHKADVAKLGELNNQVKELRNLLKNVRDEKSRSEKKLSNLEKASDILRLNCEELVASMADSAERSEASMDVLHEQLNEMNRSSIESEERLHAHIDNMAKKNERQLKQATLNQLAFMNNMVQAQNTFFNMFMQMQMNQGNVNPLPNLPMQGVFNSQPLQLAGANNNLIMPQGALILENSEGNNNNPAANNSLANSMQNPNFA